MSRSSMSMLMATCLLAICGGASALFQAVGNGSNQTPPMKGVGASFDVYVSLDSGATQGTVYVMLTNVTNYSASILTYMSNSSMPAAVMWVDPISAMLVPTPAQYKSFYGSVSFATNFTAANLIGPLANMSINALYTALESGMITFCLITKSAPSGLVVKVLMPVSETFTSMLESQNEFRPNVTSASGMMAYGSSVLSFAPDYSNATVTLTIYSVAGYTMSHIHMGNATSNGPVILWINPTSAALFSPSSPGFDIGELSFSFTFNASSVIGYMSSSMNSTMMNSTMNTMTNNTMIKGSMPNGTMTNGTMTNGTMTNGTMSNNSTSLLSMAQAARIGHLYANVHSVEYPAGVCRGQYMFTMMM